MKIVTFVGIRKSGKTSSVEALIGELKKRGYTVGSVKYIGCPAFSMDKPNSNTARHIKAGADVTVARGLTETDFIYPKKMDANDIFTKLDCDILILEGDTGSKVPRVVCAHEKKDALERINEETFLISGRLADKEKEVNGIRAVSALSDITYFADEVLRNVKDEEFPIGQYEREPSYTGVCPLDCRKKCDYR